MVLVPSLSRRLSSAINHSLEANVTVAMPITEGVLLAHYGDLLCDLLVERGDSEEAVLAGTGLTRAQLRESGRHMSLAATLQLFRNSRRLDPSADLGVRLGAPLNIGSHGFLGYAFQSSSTLGARSEEHTSELQSRPHLVCRLLLEKKKSIHIGVCAAD